MRIWLTSLFIAISSLSLTGCADRPVGSVNRPFTVMFIPSVDAKTIASRSQDFEKFLSKKVSQALYGKDEGFYVKTSVPTSYIAVVEALGTNKVDFVVFTTFGYVLAKDMRGYPVEPVATVLRGSLKEKNYWGQIITRVDSGINKIEDLKGKKFAYTDPASLTGFILPAALFRTKGVELADFVFGQKHDSVVTMVYQGQVAAGATYYNTAETVIENGKKVERPTDARARVKTQFPDVFEKVKILTLTEPIPNEPWVIRTNLYKDPQMNEKVKTAVTDALFEYAATPEGEALVRDVATGTGLVRATDADYEGVRRMIKEAQVNIEEVLKKQKS